MPSFALHALALVVTLGIAAFALGVIAHMGRAYGRRAFAALSGTDYRSQRSWSRTCAAVNHLRQAIPENPCDEILRVGRQHVTPRLGIRNPDVDNGLRQTRGCDQYGVCAGGVRGFHNHRFFILLSVRFLGSLLLNSFYTRMRKA